jgi:hypothetical protein
MNASQYCLVKGKTLSLKDMPRVKVAGPAREPSHVEMMTGAMDVLIKLNEHHDKSNGI